MKIAVFGRKFEKSLEETGLFVFFDKLCQYNAEIYIHRPFLEFLKKNSSLKLNNYLSFESYREITKDFDFFFSLGGDGTFLEAVRYVRNTGIPMVGINIGRLGFLANIAQEEIGPSLENIFSGSYSIEQRSLIEFNAEQNIFGEFPFGLNEITVQKLNNSLITIETAINGNYLNTYWTDGLIISTPTGSTAYSMSVGGPILSPECRSFVISPIASHNLSVRPIIISDDVEIILKVHSRSGKVLATIDSKSGEFLSGTEIRLKLAGFKIKMVQLPNHTFYGTIRKKLMLGVDIRN
jgi:NAD+ kinase